MNKSAIAVLMKLMGEGEDARLEDNNIAAIPPMNARATSRVASAKTFAIGARLGPLFFSFLDLRFGLVLATCLDPRP